MSIAALSLILGYLAIFGIAEQAPEDEGVIARIFQLLLVGQVPIIAHFALKWLPERPKQSWLVLTMQIVAALVPFIFVFLLEM